MHYVMHYVMPGGGLEVEQHAVKGRTVHRHAHSHLQVTGTGLQGLARTVAASSSEGSSQAAYLDLQDEGRRHF